MKNVLIAAAVIAILGLGAYVWYQQNNPRMMPTPETITQPNSQPMVSATPEPQPPIEATYNCAGKKTIKATFANDQVQLILSDGRTLTLPAAISASGARFANADETIVFWNKGNTAFLEENGKKTYDQCTEAAKPQTQAQLANPASVNCTQQGGTLTIEKRPDGGEYGLCTFEDNRACEEWALMRGKCPKGGVKTTGYDTIDQKFCVWSGGTTTATANSVCTLPDGSKCATKAFYEGTCQASSTTATTPSTATPSGLR